MSDFVSLTSVLEPWFDKDRSDLPDDLASPFRGSRQEGCLHFLLSSWYCLSPSRRRIVAEQLDISQDPANEETEMFDLVAHRFDLDVDLKELLTGPTTDIATKQQQRNDLLRQITDIDARLSELATNGRRAARDTGGSLELARSEDERRRTKARPPHDRIELALRELRDVEKVDIQNHDRGLLQGMALKKSGIADGTRGSHERTFQRALKKVLESD